jgi:hypothetical protein
LELELKTELKTVQTAISLIGVRVKFTKASNDSSSASLK